MGDLKDTYCWYCSSFHSSLQAVVNMAAVSIAKKYIYVSSYFYFRLIIICPSRILRQQAVSFELFMADGPEVQFA